MKHRTQIRYKLTVGRTIGDLAKIKLKRHLWGPFWETVDTMIPVGFDELAEAITWGTQELIDGEAARLERRAYWNGTDVPEMLVMENP